MTQRAIVHIEGGDASGLVLLFRCREDYTAKDGRFRGYVAECGDISIGPTFHSPLCKLARAIIAADPACADMTWRLIRDGRPALEGKRLATLAALDVREDGGTYFGKHKEPPAKMGRHNRRKPHSSGHLAVSGSEMAGAQVGAVCKMRRRGGK
jgi:hypothetical protein